MQAYSAPAAPSQSLERVTVAIVLFIIGFLSVQRFILNPLNSILCLVPYLLFIFYLFAKRLPAALACLVLSLVYSVDNGGEVYAETPAALRYLIYLSAMIIMLSMSQWRLRPKAVLAGGLLVGGVAIGSVLNSFSAHAVFDDITLRRDIQVLVILSIFLLPREDVSFDLKLIYAGALGYLFGEVANAAFFYAPGPDYMSYDSLKVFVIFPLLYVLMTRRGWMIQVVLAAMILVVLSLYGTRMITASALVLFLVATMLGSINSSNRWSYALIAVASLALAGAGAMLDGVKDVLASTKAFSFLAVLAEHFNEANALQLFAVLDPVRFAEHQLFFSRSWPEILFGNGPGSGLIDREGLLDFIAYAPSAFTEQERSESIYFNFHDFWIDFGLRFGLIAVVGLIYCLTVQQMVIGRVWSGVLFGMLLLNSTFAVSGLILLIRPQPT
jgi:hypothetical protein